MKSPMRHPRFPVLWWRSGLRRLMCCRPRLALDNCFRNDRDILGLLSVNLGSLYMLIASPRCRLRYKGRVVILLPVLPCGGLQAAAREWIGM